MSEQYILMVEDNKNVQAFNKMEFEERGYTVKLAYTIAQARKAINSESPTLIILDIGMPDENGLDFLREIRSGETALSTVPILMLTGYGKDSDVVAGFESGCNDYLSKPYTFAVLFMRAKELLSRAAQSTQIVTKGQLTMDKISGRAYLSGKDLLLKPKEFALLFILAQNEGTLMRARELYDKVWNAPIGSDKRALQTRISAIRKKLEDENSAYTIKSIYGEGYCFEKI